LWDLCQVLFSLAPVFFPRTPAVLVHFCFAGVSAYICFMKHSFMLYLFPV
jgi:hypothetical protein